MVTLSIAVMLAPWIPQRRAWATRFVREVQGGADTTIVEAVPGKGVWDTSRRSWRSIAPGATHHLVVQDDIAACPNFVELATAAIEVHPDDPISFWTMRQRGVIDAYNEGLRWVRTTDGNYGASTCLPVPMADRMLPWIAANIHPDYKHDDRRVTAYIQTVEKRPIWYTVPSLLEHLAPTESTLGNGMASRVATVFHHSGEPIDWDTGYKDGPASYHLHDIPWIRPPQPHLPLTKETPA